jgi:hypothetical protein
MSYSTIGEAIYAYMEELDISPALPEPEEGDPDSGWGDKLNRPPKSDELHVYPAFVVMPARDTQELGDTETDFDSVTYSVYTIFSFYDATMSEEQIRGVVDIVRTKFRELRYDPSPLLAAAYNLSFAGEWGGTQEQGERWYRLDVTVNIHESLIEESP